MGSLGKPEWPWALACGKGVGGGWSHGFRGEERLWAGMLGPC